MESKRWHQQHPAGSGRPVVRNRPPPHTNTLPRVGVQEAVAVGVGRRAETGELAVAVVAARHKHVARRLRAVLDCVGAHISACRRAAGLASVCGGSCVGAHIRACRRAAGLASVCGGGHVSAGVTAFAQ
eukprot:363910-Chlamydomonas_euryale.AAC.18